MAKTKPSDYKALTYVHLPIIEKSFNPGDTVTAEELAEAGQTDDNVNELVKGGSLGSHEDDIRPSHIIPRADMPTIELVVAETKALVEAMDANGQEVPDELRAMANLDYQHVRADDAATGGDDNASA